MTLWQQIKDSFDSTKKAQQTWNSFFTNKIGLTAEEAEQITDSVITDEYADALLYNYDRHAKTFLDYKDTLSAPNVRTQKDRDAILYKMKSDMYRMRHKDLYNAQKARMSRYEFAKKSWTDFFTSEYGLSKEESEMIVNKTFTDDIADSFNYKYRDYFTFNTSLAENKEVIGEELAYYVSHHDLENPKNKTGFIARAQGKLKNRYYGQFDHVAGIAYADGRGVYDALSDDRFGIKDLAADTSASFLKHPSIQGYDTNPVWDNTLREYKLVASVGSQTEYEEFLKRNYAFSRYYGLTPENKPLLALVPLNDKSGYQTMKTRLQSMVEKTGGLSAEESRRVINNVLPDAERLEKQFDNIYTSDSLLFDGTVELLQRDIEYGDINGNPYTAEGIQDMLSRHFRQEEPIIKRRIGDLKRGGGIRPLKISEQEAVKDLAKEARSRYAKEMRGFVSGLGQLNVVNDRLKETQFSISELSFFKEQMDMIQQNADQYPILSKIISPHNYFHSSSAEEAAFFSDMSAKKNEIAAEAAKLKQALFPAVEESAEEVIEEVKNKVEPIHFEMPKLSRQTGLAIAAMGLGIATVRAVNQNRGPDTQFFGQRPTY